MTDKPDDFENGSGDLGKDWTAVTVHAPTCALRWWSCKVCAATPDADGRVSHGRGCFVVDEDGGGESYVECTCGHV